MGCSFRVTKTDAASKARLGVLTTPHGRVATPAFMPVGTQATVKAMTPDECRSLGAEILLANAYHLYLRPGVEVVEAHGGLHRFMGWDGPLLTDSGGFQVMSLAKLRKITPDGVMFQSHIDGSEHLLSPEKAVAIQEALGADIIMALDECAPYPTTYDYAREAMVLTNSWAERCRAAKRRDDQALFGIVQGGMFADLRAESARAITALEFDGHAIGGLSVGESKELLRTVVEATVPLLPEASPRYLMGVGTPLDLVEQVMRGIDLFDCVLPTRNARTGTLYTSQGRIIIKHARYLDDLRPLDPDCPCYTCATFTRSYLRHLFQAGEILASRLNTLHNLTFYMRLMAEIRGAIPKGGLETIRERVEANFMPAGAEAGGHNEEDEAGGSVDIT